MIQRIQSVWFLLASACAFLSLKLPFYVGTTKDHLSAYQLTGSENYFLMLLTIIIGAIAFITIFLFKRRRRQVRLSVFGMMLELVLIFLYYLEVRNYKDIFGHVVNQSSFKLSYKFSCCYLFCDNNS